jgi:lysozyme
MDGQVINPKGLAIIKAFEGWSSKPYKCPAGVPTIGYGSTHGMYGEKITMSHLHIDKEEGEVLLLKELEGVYRAIQAYVKVPLTNNQYSALCSFIYNVGSGNFRASTLLRLLNYGDYEGAAMEFPKWRMAAGKILKGLIKRRKFEQELFRG